MWFSDGDRCRRQWGSRTQGFQCCQKELGLRLRKPKVERAARNTVHSQEMLNMVDAIILKLFFVDHSMVIFDASTALMAKLVSVAAAWLGYASNYKEITSLKICVYLRRSHPQTCAHSRSLKLAYDRHEERLYLGPLSILLSRGGQKARVRDLFL